MVADNKIYEPIVWPYRLIGNFLILGLIWLTTCGIITVRHNLVGQHIDSILSEIYSKTATVGWGLNDIIVEGRQKTQKQDILQALQLQRGDNILEIDLNELNAKLKTLPWIKNARITRRYFPNVIHISIEERDVKSIWQYQNNFYPIDEDGKIVETEYVPEKKFMQIVGKGAPEHIKELMDIISEDEDLASRLKAANFISERRWDLIFNDVENGITVKMPEENFKEAWKKLVKLDKTRGILKRKLTFIDLRLKNKVIVKIDNRDHSGVNE